MKRLLAQVGLTYLSVLAAAFYLSRPFVLVIAVAAALLLLIFLLVKKFRVTIFLPAMAITAIIACIVNIVFTDFVVNKTVNEYSHGTHNISATLQDESYNQYGRNYYRLKANTIDNEKCNFDFLLVSKNDIDIEPFDKIEFSASLDKNNNNYYRAKGYFLKKDAMYGDFEYKVKKTESKPLYYYTIKIREYIRDILDDTLDKDSSALCKTILIGDSQSIKSDTKELFEKTGSTYFIVVSGMHFSIISAMFLLLFRKLFRKRVIYIPLTIGIIIIYMAVTGFSMSVMRSGIMMIVFLLGQCINKDAYSLNSLGLSAVIITLIFSPYSAGDIGLILSFSSTFGIIKWSALLYQKIKIKKSGVIPYLLNRIVNIICIFICANVLTLPISILTFKGFSLVTLLSSVVLSLPIELLLILSLFICVVFYIPLINYVNIVLGFVANLTSRFILWFVKTFSAFDLSYIRISDAYVYVILAMISVLFVVMFIYTRKYDLVKYVLISALMILCAGICSATMLKDNANLSILSVGDEMAVMLSYNEKYAMLDLDCSSQTLSDVMDYAELYTKDFDFLAVISGKRATKTAKTFSKEFAISHALLYDIDSVYADNIANDETIFLNEKHSAIFSDKISIEYIRTAECAVQYLQTKNKSVLILPKMVDIKTLPKSIKNADYIILSEIPKNYQELSCDKLIVSNFENTSKLIAKELSSIYESVMLTCDGNILLDLEV